MWEFCRGNPVKYNKFDGTTPPGLMERLRSYLEEAPGDALPFVVPIWLGMITGYFLGAILYFTTLVMGANLVKWHPSGFWYDWLPPNNILTHQSTWECNQY